MTHGYKALPNSNVPLNRLAFCQFQYIVVVQFFFICFVIDYCFSFVLTFIPSTKEFLCEIVMYYFLLNNDASLICKRFSIILIFFYRPASVLRYCDCTFSLFQLSMLLDWRTTCRWIGFPPIICPFHHFPLPPSPEDDPDLVFIQPIGSQQASLSVGTSASIIISSFSCLCKWTSTDQYFV